jgi:NADP-dependent 3-hydroxy acid dehydrogenase YdfG
VGAVATELSSRITDPQSAAGIQKFYEGYAISTDSFARSVAFAIEQPDDVDINKILFRLTRQEL